MTDWNKIADGLNAGIPATQMTLIRPTLDGLETAFRPLIPTLTPADDFFAPEIEL